MLDSCIIAMRCLILKRSISLGAQRLLLYDVNDGLHEKKVKTLTGTSTSHEWATWPALLLFSKLNKTFLGRLHHENVFFCMIKINNIRGGETNISTWKSTANRVYGNMHELHQQNSANSFRWSIRTTDMARCTGHRYATTHNTPHDFWATEPCSLTESFPFNRNSRYTGHSAVLRTSPV